MNPIHHSRSTKQVLLGLAVAALSMHPAGTVAQEQAPPLDSPLLVSFDGKNVELEDVLQSFAQQVKAELDLAPEVHGQLSLKLRGARLESAMNDLCTAYNCSWELEDEPKRELIVRPQEEE